MSKPSEYAHHRVAKLELELTALREELEATRARLAEAEKDTMRLDWLQNSPLADVRIVGYGSPRRRGGTLRNAIDAARSREEQE